MSKAQWMKENIKKGEQYAGIILSNNGQPDYHLVLLSATPGGRLTWGKAKEWASTVGGELPTRNEQSLLFANLKHEFEAAWYWSSEQNAASPDYAWMQDFGYGDQYYSHESYEYRARAVRRLLIIE
ncbi:DUF1566 domain-containing protein [Collimonas fungivorans]|uniref:DUF1566 domain-containing protein n=1 Tax=Collimonas fungivorans TaxID=158899 RepID=UPI0005A2661C|nr:DUF1566 domain-containing protein [Collimonas fungivorans]